MKNLLLVAAAICLLVPTICFAQTNDKYALLVGVSKYQHSRLNDNPLKFPEADATSVAELLKSSGYTVEVLLGKDATQSAIKSALDKAGKQGTEGGAVLIGLFGHGVQYGKSAYYCPFDSSIRRVKDSKGNGLANDAGEPLQEPDPGSLVSLSETLDALSICGASNRILLAECSRDDPNRARGRNPFGTTLRVGDLPSGTVALFACSANEQAFEHKDWGHSAFVFALLKEISKLHKTKSPVSMGMVFDRVHRTVKKMVADKTAGNAAQNVQVLMNGYVDLLLSSPHDRKGEK